MDTCKHELEVCSICLNGAGYDPWGTNPGVDYRAHLYDLDERDKIVGYRGGENNPAPSEALYEEAVMIKESDAYWNCLACDPHENPFGPYYDDHTCIGLDFVYRPTATQFLPTVGRPEWLRTQFHGASFLGFYKTQLGAIRGHGLDPDFMAVTSE